MMKIVAESEFVDELARYGIGFDTRFPAPQTIGFRDGNMITIPIPAAIGDIARLLCMVVKIYDSADALWMWRRSGTWVPGKWDLEGWRGDIIRGFETLV